MGQRITMQDLHVGEPVRWNVYDRHGMLLLRSGELVPNERAIERLVENGLFVQDDDHGGGHAPEVIPAEPPSTLQHVVDARRHLAALFAQPPDQLSDFSGRIDKTIESVLVASEVQPILSLASVLLVQDMPYSVRHPVDVAILSRLLAKALELDADTQRLTVAASVTMNVGMYEIQEKLNGISGPLNDKLQEMIKRHPALGVARLRKLGITDEKWLTLVHQHHELADGTGYPAGLAGEAIEIGARIIGVASKYCAMVSARTYRVPLKPTTALRELCVKQGPKIDTKVAGALIRVLGIYPPGTLVRLKTAEIGVVTGPGLAPDTPSVHAVLGRSGAALEVASHRKTHLAQFAIDEVLSLNQLMVPIRLAGIWGRDAKLS